MNLTASLLGPCRFAPCPQPHVGIICCPCGKCDGRVAIKVTKELRFPDGSNLQFFRYLRWWDHIRALSHN